MNAACVVEVTSCLCLLVPAHLALGDSHYGPCRIVGNRRCDRNTLYCARSTREARTHSSFHESLCGQSCSSHRRKKNGYNSFNSSLCCRASSFCFTRSELQRHRRRITVSKAGNPRHEEKEIHLGSRRCEVYEFHSRLRIIN